MVESIISKSSILVKAVIILGANVEGIGKNAGNERP
jgi:hypothetical protein